LKYYAGLTSSFTPTSDLLRMGKISSLLESYHYTLRTGISEDDNPFKKGATQHLESWDSRESYFPLQEWAIEMTSEVCLERPLERMTALEISNLVQGAYFIFGDSSEMKPVEFVVYWSELDPLTPLQDLNPLVCAVRVAHNAQIPTYNLRNQKEKFVELISQIKSNHLI
jgi:hypothetical protein